MTKLVANIEMYAQLLQSVGRQGSGSNRARPLKPVECAQYIKRLIEEENATLSEVAERLDLGRSQDQSNIYKKRDTSQVTSFLNLLKVSEKSRELAGWGYEGYPTIAFSLISQLSTLTPDEQDLIIQSVFNPDNRKKMLGKEDVKKIKMWRRENPDLPIEECIKKILKMMPTTTITHMVVSETREKLNRFIRLNTDYRKKLLDILRSHMEGEFYSIEATDILITISMDETAYKTFHDHQYKKNVSFTQFLNDFLEDKIE